MAVRATPSFVQAGSHPAEETRLMVASLVGAATGSFSGGVASADSAHGVVLTSDLAVTANGTPNMSVNIAAGGAFIRNTESANGGAYHLWNDATLNLAIAAADATNARRDLVIAQVRDAAYSGASNDARIIVVTGTPAASPSDPSLSSYPNALVLARVAVAAGATSITSGNITDLRTLANVRSELPVVASTTARDQFIPSPLDGQAVYVNANTSAEGPYFYNGTAWRLPWNMPWGSVGRATTTSNVAANSATDVDVTGLSITTATLPSNRIIKWTVTGHYLFDSVNDVGRFSVKTGSSGGTAIGIYDFFPSTVSWAEGWSFSFYEVTASTAALTRRVTVRRLSGTTDDVRFFADADRFGYFFGEDIGPSGAPT